MNFGLVPVFLALGAFIGFLAGLLGIGGGFTTFDCARTSRRLGAEVTVVYRRSRKEMGAHYSEVDDAEHEGIKLEFYAAPVKIVEKNGRVGPSALSTFGYLR